MAGRMSLLFGVVALGPAISVASIANRGAVYEWQGECLCGSVWWLLDLLYRWPLLLTGVLYMNFAVQMFFFQ